MTQIETIRVNVLGMLNLADICYQKQVHLTTYATGTPWLDSPCRSCWNQCAIHNAATSPTRAMCVRTREACVVLGISCCALAPAVYHPLRQSCRCGVLVDSLHQCARTGCIFHYDKDFPEGSGKGFKECDKPNFTGSYYSHTKVLPATGRLCA